MGTAFGLTTGLFNFWKKNKFEPVYLRQTKNKITGEHSCIMIRPLREANIKIHQYIKKHLMTADDSSKTDISILSCITLLAWVATYSAEFRKRFLSLLSYRFNNMDLSLALSITDPPLTTSPLSQQTGASAALTKSELEL